MLFDSSQIQLISARHMMELAEEERAARLSYYDRRYKMHKGLVTDPHEAEYDEQLCREVFPKGRTETIEEYRERLKLWVPLGRLIVDRLIELMFKGSVVYDFAEEGDYKRANDIIASDLEYNNWNDSVRTLVSQYLGIGEMSTWLSYRSHDPETGKEFDNGGRIKFVNRFPWFAEMIVHPDNVTEQIGSIALYDYDNYRITPNVTAKMNLNGEHKRRIELWLAPRFDSRTGEQLAMGGYWEFENEQVVNSGDLEKFTERNWYEVDPTIFWVSPDKDETQYRGVSYHDRYIDSWLKLSRVASNEVSQIQYLVSIWKLLFAEKTPPVIELRANAVNAIPLSVDSQPDLAQTERMLDLKEEREFKKFLTNVIGEAGGYSGDLMTGMEGVGKVAESGIARKIVYEKTLDTVRGLRANFSQPMKRLMLNCVKIRNYEANLGIDVSKLKPRVTFDDDIMPLDDSQVLLDDILKYEKKIYTLEELIFKHNPRFKTLDEVRDYIENQVKPQMESERQERVQQLQMQQPQKPIFTRRNDNRGN